MEWSTRAHRALWSFAGTGILLIDEQLVIRWANETASLVAGVHDLAGTSALELVHPDDLDDVASVLSHHSRDAGFYRARDLSATLPLARQIRVRTYRRDAEGNTIVAWRVVLGRVENRLGDGEVDALVVRLDLVGDQSSLGRALELLSSDGPIDDMIGEVLRFMAAENSMAAMGFVWWDRAGRRVLVEGMAPEDAGLLTHPSIYEFACAHMEGERCTTMFTEGDVFGQTMVPETLQRAGELGLRAVSVVPISRRDAASGEPMGVLVYWTPYDHALTLAPQMAVTVAVDLLALALTDHQRRDRLTDEARRDPLTGLYNRAGLLAAAEQLLESAAELFVLYLDLDHFKPINDRWGHQTGDRVLVEVAARLLRSCREGDVVARLGGDEFVVICRTDLPDPTGWEGAARRLMHEVNRPIAVGSETVHVQASVGIAGCLVDDTLSEVLARADAALYEAKRRTDAGPVSFPSE